VLRTVFPLVADAAVANSRAAEDQKTPDAELNEAMERYVDGDLAAFDELYRALAPRLYAYLVSLVRSRSRSDDLLQVTFLRIHAARASWIRGARVQPYAYAIARNTALDELRRERRARVRLTNTGEPPDTPAPAPNSADHALAVRVETALMQLPPKFREAIVLTKQHELTHREAALITGTSPMAIKLRVHRGYKLLREHLAQLAPEADR